MKVYDIVVRTTAGVFEFTNAILEDCYGDNEFITVVDNVGRTSFNRDHIIFISSVESFGITGKISNCIDITGTSGGCGGIGPEYSSLKQQCSKEYWESRNER